MIDWELRPFKGFGPLEFGLRPSEVDRRLGPARFEKRHGETDFRQYRGKGERGYDVILGFDPAALTDGTFPAQRNPIHVRGVQVFEADPIAVVAALEEANAARMESTTRACSPSFLPRELPRLPVRTSSAKLAKAF